MCLLALLYLSVHIVTLGEPLGCYREFLMEEFSSNLLAHSNGGYWILGLPLDLQGTLSLENSYIQSRREEFLGAFGT
jgi:hypothetical protein